MSASPSSLRSFTELIAWQKARELRKAVSALARTWPAEEKYRLADQIVRSGRSACANIAEGYGRYYEKDNLRFCRQAKGSITETMDHLTAAYDEGLLDAAALGVYWARCEEALRVLNGYMGYLGRVANGSIANEPPAGYGAVGDGIHADTPSDVPLTTGNGQPTTANR